MFNFFSNKKCSRRDYFLDICKELVEDADSHFTTYPSCKEDILPVVNNMIKDITSSQWKLIPDIEKSAYSTIFNVAFDVAVSGKYHLGYGVVNPISPMLQFKYLVYKCLDYALEHGDISEAEKEQQYNNFVYGLSHAG